MHPYRTADAEHNTYALAIADAIGRHTAAIRDAGVDAVEPTEIDVPGGGWTLTRGDVTPAWHLTRHEHGQAVKILRFEGAIDPTAAVMRAFDDSRPCAYALTAAGEAELAHA
jgi:hypothetical protein